MFVPDVRPILQAHKQAQELCKSGALKTVAHRCPNRGIAPPSAAENCRPSLAAFSVACIFGALYLIYIGTIWLYYNHRTGMRGKYAEKLEDVLEEQKSDEQEEEYRQLVDRQARNRKIRRDASFRRRAVRPMGIGRNEESWFSDGSSTHQEPYSH